MVLSGKIKQVFEDTVQKQLEGWNFALCDVCEESWIFSLQKPKLWLWMGSNEKDHELL